MAVVRVIGVDPGMTGAAVDTFHGGDGMVQIAHLWSWDQPHKTGKQGQQVSSALNMREGGLVGALKAAMDQVLFDGWGGQCIVRVEETWYAARSRTVAASHSMSAAPWLLMASPLDNYEFFTPDEWRVHYGWSGSLRKNAKELVIDWANETYARMVWPSRVSLSEHLAEAMAIAMLPIPEGSW